MLTNLKDKNIIITGGTSGLGLSVSKHFEAKNNVIIVGNRNYRKVKNSKKVINSNIYKTDLTNNTQTEQMFKKIKLRYNKIDLIVCFAGISKPIKFKDIGPSHWLNSFKANFLTATNTIESYDKTFKKKKTKIILISTICAQDKMNCSVPYSVSKAALNFYCKNISKEYSQKGIYINAVSLGNIYTKDGLWDKKLRLNRSKVINSIKKNVPLKRFGKINELINIIEYLASDNSNFHLGSNIIMDGGQTL